MKRIKYKIKKQDGKFYPRVLVKKWWGWWKTYDIKYYGYDIFSIHGPWSVVCTGVNSEEAAKNVLDEFDKHKEYYFQDYEKEYEPRDN